jgi:radical SAM family uncharacterized protein/radical SAM-linked protein
MPTRYQPATMSRDQLRAEVEAILPRVERPTRYLGNEVNAIRKDPAKADVSVCLCFPELYEVGMSWPGLQILYHILNTHPGVVAERAYSPWFDMEKEMRAAHVPAFSLESWTPLANFDVLGFTLQYELTFTNLLNVLDLAGIPKRSADRRRDDPVVIAGGPVSYNCEPIADFLDAVCLGDGEEGILEVCNAVKAWKATDQPRSELLRKLQTIEGVYVPSHYDVEYATELTGTMAPIAAIKPKENAPKLVRRRFQADLNDVPFPSAPIVPLGKTVHNRLGIEVQRGCTRACRFCQAGYIYRPERQRSPEKVKELVFESLKNTGYDEVSLLSLSIGDYGCLEPLIGDLLGPNRANGISVSLPSIRVDTLTEGIIDKIAGAKKSGFTVAPEAGSERLRDVINKALSEQQIEFTAEQVFKRGWTHIKFYYMIGLPSETDEDVMGIVRTARACQAIGRKYNKQADIHVSTSTFVPKPYTPFQWEPQISRDEVIRKQSMLRDELKKTGLTFKWHDAKESMLEVVLSRGDRRLCRAVELAWEKGARFDGWTEKYREDIWLQSFAEAGVHPGWYAYRRIPVAEVLPWDHIDCGMEKAWFIKDYEWSFRGKYIPDCATGRCYDCGICDWKIVKNRTYVPAETLRYPHGMKPKGMGEHPQPIETAFTTQSGWLKPYPGVDVALMGIQDGGGKKAKPEAVAAMIAAAKPTPVIAPEETLEEEPAANSVHEMTDAPVRRAPPPQRKGSRHPPARPSLGPSKRYRVHYEKTSRAAYLGHLDTMEALARALKRVGVKLDYSQGWSPAPKLAFGPALMTGAQSTAEYFDMDCVEPFPETEPLAAKLSAQLPEGMRIDSVTEIEKTAKSLGGSIVAQTFVVDERFAGALPLPADLRRKVERFLAAEHANVTTRRMDGRKEIVKTTDTRPSVNRAWVDEQGRLNFELKSSSTFATAKPIDVVRSILGEEKPETVDAARLVLTKTAAAFA